MLRPKDIIDDIGVSAPSLRLWSKRFSELLSPGAQSSQTDTGGSAQRRYSQDDLELFRTAKRFLDAGKTYEETLLALKDQEPVPAAPEPSPAHKAPTIDLAVIEPVHPVVKAFEEALKAKAETIRSLEARAAEVAAAKDETIALLTARIDDLSQSLLTAQTSVQPQSARAPTPTRFRWAWLARLLTGKTQDVGLGTTKDAGRPVGQPTPDL